MTEYWTSLHTETARALGQERHQFLMKFITQLPSELSLTSNTENLWPRL